MRELRELGEATPAAEINAKTDVPFFPRTYRIVPGQTPVAYAATIEDVLDENLLNDSVFRKANDN